MRSETNTPVLKNIFLILLMVFALSACGTKTPEVTDSSLNNPNKPSGIKVEENTSNATKQVSPDNKEGDAVAEKTDVNNEGSNTNEDEINSNNKQMDTKVEENNDDLASKYAGVVMKTNLGDITIKLYSEESPITVNNFLKLAKSDYYDGVKFHRVIPNFMVQAGDPLTKDDAMMSRWGTGGPGYAIADEYIEGLSNVRGSIAMANSGPNTGGSQFFINVVNNTGLDWDKQPSSSKHPVFGIVIDGIEVADEISKVKTAERNRPDVAVVIEDIELLEEME